MNLPVNKLTPINFANTFLKSVSGRIGIILVLLFSILWIGSPNAQQTVSADQAAQIVQQRTGGQVLGVQVPKQFNATVYRVRVLLPDGRVREWQVDAQTGRIINP